MTLTDTRAPSTRKPKREGLGSAVHAEWTKFRTVRGWRIGLLVAVLLSGLFTFLVAHGSHEGGCNAPPLPGSGPNSPGSNCFVGHPFVPTGPDGRPVADSYQFVGQSLTGDGTLTARVTSLSGVISTNPSNEAATLAHTRPELTPWSKAGLLLTPSTKQGSPYTAVMATGSHGIRWQYNYTHDSSGLPGPISPASPRWLRLTRAGDTLTGYDSTNGTNWTRIATTRLAGLPAKVTIGLFVTSPLSFHNSTAGLPTQTTAAFDHVSIQSSGTTPRGAWRGQSIGNGANNYYPTLGTGSYQRTDDAFVISGSGDIALGVGKDLLGTDTAASTLLLGLLAGLLVVIVIAAMFITVEYRRGLIRTTFTATPRRHPILAAKSLVIAAVAFIAGAVATAVDLLLGDHLLTANGNYVFPVNALTDARIVIGTGAILALSAAAVLALGFILRRSAGTVTAGIVVFVLPYVLGQSLSGGAQQWIFRLTPAAGLDVLGTLPRTSQVDYPYTLSNGYYPLAPWAAVAVLCVWAALSIGAASFLLRRRDV